MCVTTERRRSSFPQLVGDKLLGSCMVYLPSFHIDQTPFEGYLPVTTNEGPPLAHRNVVNA